jgi:hypothetical protein
MGYNSSMGFVTVQYWRLRRVRNATNWFGALLAWARLRHQAEDLCGCRQLLIGTEFRSELAHCTPPTFGTDQTHSQKLVETGRLGVDCVQATCNNKDIMPAISATSATSIRGDIWAQATHPFPFMITTNSKRRPGLGMLL